MIRRPSQKTVKHTFKTFDEVIIAPMMLFEPRVVDFDAKKPLIDWRKSDVDDGQEYTLDQPVGPPPPLSQGPSSLIAPHIPDCRDANVHVASPPAASSTGHVAALCAALDR